MPCDKWRLIFIDTETCLQYIIEKGYKTFYHISLKKKRFGRIKYKMLTVIISGCYGYRSHTFFFFVIFLNSLKIMHIIFIIRKKQ